MYLLRLRKILLCDYLFYIIFLLSLLISIIRITLPRKSIYQEGEGKVIGTIIKKEEQDSYTTYVVKAKEKVLVESKDNNYFLGDKIEVTGIFKIPNKNTTKYLFNYQEYLKRKGIYYIVEEEQIKKIKNNHNFIYWIKDKIELHIKKDPYLETFLLGNKNYVREEVIRSYQENGISHLFAISGMHIALLSSILEKCLKNFFKESTWKYISVLLCFYLLLVGFSPSILRGVLFYLCFKINEVYYFYIKKENIFLFIFSFSILINPFYLYDIGFWYSYLISYSLLKMSNLISSNNKIISLLKVSTLSFFSSIPITLKNFYQLNFLSILYNLFYVPFISTIIFPLTLITFLFPKLLPIYHILIIVLEKSSLFLEKIKLGKLIFKRVPIVIYIIYFILLFFYLYTKKKKYKNFLLMILIIHFILPFINQTDYLKMIDVGQGDCILMKSNNHSVLIDTGGSYTSNGKLFYHTIEPILKMEGIKKLDYLILTHGDMDHLGEAKELIENIKIKKILLNNNSLNSYEQELVNKNTTLGVEGYSFQVGDFFYTELNGIKGEENESSQIYLVTYQDIKILLMGDASIKSEEYILENYELPKIDILKVGHHGSNTSTKKEFIEKIKPTIALISSGKDNKFHHPHKETIETLEENYTKIYNTQNNGTITINLSKNKIILDG